MMQVANYKTIGMQRDNSESAFDSKFAFENMNMRITARDNNTLLSLSNERGNALMSTNNVLFGNPIGYTVLNDKLILFTTMNLTSDTTYNDDRIYKITKSQVGNSLVVTTLYTGQLYFDATHPIECIPFYENENIQKVYWTDGKNQMRFINIVSTETYDDNSFDFVPIMDLKEGVSIIKNNYGGSFPPGVIQYAFSYINNYGIETNIFHTSPLYYLSNSETGGAADTTVSNSFSITITNVDTSFDKVRVYSIIRTSINATPIIKKVLDITTSSTVVLTDTNYLGETQTATSLLYTGGDKIIAGTIAQKDNTLFLGNVELVEAPVGNILVGGTQIKDILGVNNPAHIVYAAKTLESSTTELTLDSGSFYPYETSRTLKQDDFKAKTFKYLEYYRFGIQFQHESGKWSEALWITDKQNTILPETSMLYNYVPYQGSFNTIIKGSKADYILNNTTVLNTLVSLGYRKVRGLVVYPNINERRVIAQGILNPTVYQIKDRADNSPTIQSSWFLRPMKTNEDINHFETFYSDRGGSVEFRHNMALSGVREYAEGSSTWSPKLSRGAEISNFYHSNPSFNNVSYPLTPYVQTSGDPTRDSVADLINLYGDAFIVDKSSVTFNSPDVEFDEDLANLNLELSELKILGLTHLTGFVSDNSVTPTNPLSTSCGGFLNLEINLYLEFFNGNIVRLRGEGINICGATPMWHDAISGGVINGTFVIFPWHARRSFTNHANTEANAPVMTSKHSSNLRFSAFNTYFTPESFTEGITTPKLFNSTENTIITLDAPLNSGLNNFTYQGNIDKIIAPTIGDGDPSGFKIFLVAGDPDIEGPVGEMTYASTGVFNDNVSMKYKSAPHLVFNFNWKSDYTQVALPVLNGLNKGVNGDAGGKLFYRNGGASVIPVELKTINVPSLPDDLDEGGGVWLADIVRPVNTTTMFGGTSQTAIELNQWQVGGLAVSLVDGSNQPLASVTVPYTAGDTYIQRHDCIRTYPYSISDELTMTEIVSFLCETRINLDARTDKNRGRQDNRFITPTNTNLLNDVYNQRDNYFTYHGLDYNLFSLNKFPNTFAWSDKKLSGNITDSWVNISMTNTYEVDGTYGGITALKTFNNTLLGFQDKATFEVSYNSRVLINASDGVPIEIANSGSVDGIRYISSASGTKNKQSIATTPFGLYYIDDINRSINIYNGQISSLTDKLGFHSWANKSFNGLKTWSPDSFDNYVTHFDNINKDIYFIGKTEALCYSELLGLFTSFFNYEKVPYMFNNWDSFYSIKKNTNPGVIEIWEQNKGLYNKFFGVNKPFYTTLMVNPHPQQDKVFNTLEFRADSWETSDNWVTPSSSSTLRRTVDFTKLKVWDEYQVGEQALVFNNGVASSLKQKFRSWRTFIPRVVSKEYTALQGGVVRTPTISGLDRLRNNWAYMLLYSDGTNNYQTVLHDINVFYNL